MQPKDHLDLMVRLAPQLGRVVLAGVAHHQLAETLVQEETEGSMVLLEEEVAELDLEQDHLEKAETAHQESSRSRTL